jgi:hypothetical protein
VQYCTGTSSQDGGPAAGDTRPRRAEGHAVVPVATAVGCQSGGSSSAAGWREEDGGGEAWRRRFFDAFRRRRLRWLAALYRRTLRRLRAFYAKALVDLIEGHGLADCSFGTAFAPMVVVGR